MTGNVEDMSGMFGVKRGSQRKRPKI